MSHCQLAFLGFLFVSGCPLDVCIRHLEPLLAFALDDVSCGGFESHCVYASMRLCGWAYFPRSGARGQHTARRDRPVCHTVTVCVRLGPHRGGCMGEPTRVGLLRAFHRRPDHYSLVSAGRAYSHGDRWTFVPNLPRQEQGL